MKRILGITFFLFYLSILGRADIVMKPPSSLVCTEVYAPSLTVDEGSYIGRYASNDFSGYIYKPSANRCICEVYAYCQNETGNQTGNNYHMRIFTIDGNDDVDTIVGTSAAVAGSTINGSGASYIGPFIFSTCVNLTSGTEYPFTIFIDTDSDLTDDPEYDSTNYWKWGYDNERNLDGIQVGRGDWTWDASIPYVDAGGGIDLEDDGDMKVSSME